MNRMTIRQKQQLTTLQKHIVNCIEATEVLCTNLAQVMKQPIADHEDLYSTLQMSLKATELRDSLVMLAARQGVRR